MLKQNTSKPLRKTLHCHNRSLTSAHNKQSSSAINGTQVRRVKLHGRPIIRQRNPRQPTALPLSGFGTTPLVAPPISTSTISTPLSFSESSPTIVLGIETSCDDTSIAIVTSNRQVLSKQSISQLGLHQLHGGVVPTIAMRSHAISINHLVAKTLLEASLIATTAQQPTELPQNANIYPTFLPSPPTNAKYQNKNYFEYTENNCTWLEKELEKLDQFRQHLFLRSRASTPTPTTQIDQTLSIDCDAIAFTLGPGLSGSLAVGVDTAKALGNAFNVPIIPVNHLIAHTTVGQLVNSKIKYPYLGLVISGGHTQLNHIQNEQTVTVLATTVDDAIGEAFDKVYRTMGMESFDFATIESIIQTEQHQVHSTLKALRSSWPNNLDELISQSNNELLMDAFTAIINDKSSETNNSNTTSTDLENQQINFINKIQCTPPVPIRVTKLQAIGNVDDLYNNETTPDAFFPTFQEALVQLEYNKKTQHNRIKIDYSTLNDNTSSPSSSSSSPSLNNDTSTTPQQNHDNDKITPKSEREVLAALSTHKTIPHGAQIELAAKMHTDVYNVLDAYEFIIKNITLSQTKRLKKMYVYSKFFQMELNRGFGVLRKAGQLLPTHRFLPIVPLPLPLNTTNPNQSYTSLSYSGFKTKIRQHVETEVQFMQSIQDLATSTRHAHVDNNTSHEQDDENLHDEDTVNPFSRQPLKSIRDVPVYLQYLTNGDFLSKNIENISNLYRLCVSAQFQMTATEHLIQKMTRSVQYLNMDLRGQDGIYLAANPQSLDQLVLPPNDPAFHIGHPAHLPDLDAWIKHSQSVLKKTLFRGDDIVPDSSNGVNHIVIGGGVACNKYITENIKHYFNNLDLLHPSITKKKSNPLVDDTNPEIVSKPRFETITIPPQYCTDNGTMIAWAGLQKFTQHQQLTTQQANTNDQHLYQEIAHTLSSSHIIDPQALYHQQAALDRHFMQLYGQVGISPDGKFPSNRAEQFSTLYQRPKWPLHEVFIPKQARRTKSSHPE